MSDSPPPPPILELTGVTVEADHHVYDAGLWQAGLVLRAGELALVRLEPERHRVPLADVACGLLDLAEGSAKFQGVDWTERSFNDAAGCRARVGRVFEGHAWVSNLDLDENVLLAGRHHTHQSDRELEEAAATLARAFGLPGLPRGRPSAVPRADRKRAALVRAFLGEPALLLLERPTADIYPDIMPPLVNAVNAARARGAAVVWTTSHTAVWADRALRPTVRFAMSGEQMTPLPAADSGPGEE
jgi:phospholipid/cholesterol/gamma-HCH transport system ATP-binding protein